jgi:glycosyltransferase involved in cell wall biosynthesis
MKRILCIDARMINNSGIGVYINNYIRYFLEKTPYHVILLGKNIELNKYFGNYTNWEYIEADFPIYSFSEQIKLPLIIPECDVFWSPHYNIPLLPIKAKKRIVTIPDTFHLAYKHLFSIHKQWYAQLVMNQAVKLADQVITISNYSRQEIIRYTGCPLDHIITIYLGIDNELFQPTSDAIRLEQVKKRYDIPDRFILFVGNVKPNKNLSTLVKSLLLVVSHQPDIYLVIVGKKEGFLNGDSELFDIISQNAILLKHIIFTNYVAFEDLPVLYSLATVFAFPSFYEGFGFPPLEAMACDCPVVASDAASIPEICGDAVYYVSPEKPESMAKGLIEVLNNQQERLDLVKRGRNQFLRYNWGVSAYKFEQVVSSLMPIN